MVIGTKELSLIGEYCTLLNIEGVQAADIFLAHLAPEDWTMVRNEALAARFIFTHRPSGNRPYPLPSAGAYPAAL
ncbi:MAG: hypothetical protein UY68_C0004G0006 [Parcubacteria group bacterium GW2011_GWF2_52_12]|nr:MAG: hypothetical protein UY68_C0004G0006 [Parcubacteria group bacterium GW2011_GWF2_52_12]